MYFGQYFTVKFNKHSDQSPAEKEMKETLKVSFEKFWSGNSKDFVDNLLISNFDNFSESEDETLQPAKFTSSRHLER